MEAPRGGDFTLKAAGHMEANDKAFVKSSSQRPLALEELRWLMAAGSDLLNASAKASLGGLIGLESIQEVRSLLRPLSMHPSLGKLECGGSSLSTSSFFLYHFCLCVLT